MRSLTVIGTAAYPPQPDANYTKAGASVFRARLIIPRLNMNAPDPLIIVTLTKRADFVRLSKQGRRVGCETLQLQALERPEGNYNSQGKWQKPVRTDAGQTREGEAASPDFIRVGFTVTKKQGNAVLRNRVKRRLRAAVRELFPAKAKSGQDYVLVGREKAADCEYAIILRDLAYALRKVEKAPTGIPLRHRAGPKDKRYALPG